MLQQIAKRKLANFRRRHGEAPYSAMEQQWTVPERLVARRPGAAGPGWEVLVKWTGLGYEHCTWEVRGLHTDSAVNPCCRLVARNCYVRRLSQLHCPASPIAVVHKASHYHPRHTVRNHCSMLSRVKRSGKRGTFLAAV